MNTRRYHRNSMLAFPRTAEYGCAVERPMDSGDKLVMWACILATVFMGVLFVWEYV